MGQLAKWIKVIDTYDVMFHSETQERGQVVTSSMWEGGA